MLFTKYCMHECCCPTLTGGKNCGAPGPVGLAVAVAPSVQPVAGLRVRCNIIISFISWWYQQQYLAEVGDPAAESLAFALQDSVGNVFRLSAPDC